MRATFLTLFPEMIESALSASILGRAQKSGAIAARAVQLRDFSHRKDKAAHHTIDDTPCGGGPGMIVRIDVAHAALEAARRADEEAHPNARRRVVLLEPRGAPFTQADARRLATYEHLVFFCGRYEGTDARVDAYVDEVISIGDYVLTGGELAALAVFDATARLVPGVLGNDASSVAESHSEHLLEHRQYAKPNVYDGVSVPAVLLGGNHAEIARARRKDQLVLTRERRPDLFRKHPLTAADATLIDDARVPSLAPVRSEDNE
jgi:tRNA (guanine37-N1)-methyltransferase